MIDLRPHFPALDEGLAHFDGPGGTQVPGVVADAVRDIYRSAVSNRHGGFPSSDRADELVDGARSAVADLLGADPGGVVLAQSMTANTYVLAGALAKTWSVGDNVVVSRLDHDANVRPWVQAARSAGVEVRWAQIEKNTHLPVEQYAQLLDNKTKLVAVTAASNATGSRPAVAEITALAHQAGALVHVDGVHATPHGPVSFAELGDLYACSAYKWYGPHLGATVASPELLETLQPDKLLPSSDAVPDRFERGTTQFEQCAAVTATVDWLASLGSGSTRRARLVDAMTRISAQEHVVFERLLSGLRGRDDVTLVGDPASRTPTVAFVKDGETPAQTAARLAEVGVCVWAGHFYAIELMRSLNRPDGAVRAGVVGYTNDDDVDRLLAAL